MISEGFVREEMIPIGDLTHYCAFTSKTTVGFTAPFSSTTEDGAKIGGLLKKFQWDINVSNIHFPVSEGGKQVEQLQVYNKLLNSFKK